MSIPRPIKFQKYDLDANAVICVDPVDCHSTGSSSCDWKYGFVVRLIGNSVTIVPPRPGNFGYSNGPTNEEYKSSVERLRKEFVENVWPAKAEK